MATSKRFDGPTPSGGDYAEFLFFDDDDNLVDEKAACKCIIRECLNDGTLLLETFGFVGRDSSGVS